MKNLKLIKPINIVLVVMGALFSALAVTQFVRVGNLIPAGMSGLSQLILMESSSKLGITLSYGLVYLILNTILLSFVFNKLGKKFLALSFLHVILTSIFIEIIPSFSITHDDILIPIFGGILNGVGSSLALKANGSSGGTDFIAIYYSMVKNKPQWDKIMYFNAALLIYSGWQYNWDLAFYSIIYQVVSTKIVDTYHDRYKLSSINIITTHADDVSKAILDTTRHGITMTEGIGVFKQEHRSILYLVANDFEVNKIVNAIKAADEKAFIEISSVERIEGNYRQKPLD